MTNENTFLDHTSYSLTKGSNWRRQQVTRYPGDPRNAAAALRLAELASQADHISDSIWNPLKPFFDPKSSHYTDALSRACRDVGFRTFPRDFDDFAQTILDGLAVSA
jgi:hypothetical protein